MPEGGAGSPIERLLRRDRLIVVATLAAATALAWIYVLTGAGMGMPAITMSGWPTAAGAMPFMAEADWTLGYAALMVAMWCLMMAGMMLPSAAPAILLFSALSRQRLGGSGAPWAFCAGYLTVWGGFGFGAVALQWALEKLALMSPEMVVSSRALGAVLLIAAGLWQLSPLKDVCLAGCRSPIPFLASRWRTGSAGAWRMGVAHGLHCLGCCWALMLLLFYGGVMNVYWIAGLSLFVLVEKTVATGRLLSRAAGVGLIAWGGYLLHAILA
ncbi:MAG: DUF2182 domain-containing protein [Alphaproteobacteria bacterium]